jgi:hypothetical protein
MCRPYTTFRCRGEVRLARLNRFLYPEKTIVLPVNELMANIFEGKANFLSQWLEAQVKASRRFRAFADHYRGKIRSKHRLAQDRDALKDLQLELEAAALLVEDTRFEIQYEMYASQNQRGPDFTVAFRVNTKFNVEVTRLRLTEAPEPDDPAGIRKFIFTLMEKAVQMPPSIINFLMMGAELPLNPDDLLQATTALKLLAERKEDEFFIRRGYKNATDFQRQFQRISGVILRPSPLHLWLNPQAKHAAANDLANALRKLTLPGNPS